MRLIDADTLLKEYDGAEYSIIKSAYAKGCNDVIAWSRRTISEAPTVDTVPVNELLKLRDWLYESDGITMGGLRSLNELIAKYSNNPLPKIENRFVSKISYEENTILGHMGRLEMGSECV